MNAAELLKGAAEALQRGDRDGCIESCTRLLKRQPGLGQALHLRGLARLQSGAVDPAIGDLAAALDALPDNAHAALFLGRALRLADRNDEAVSPLQLAIGNPALEIDARYELARCLSRIRRAREAMTHYRHIVEKRPDHAHARANLAFLLEKDNQLDAARQHASKALALDPGLGLAQLCLATVERRGGEAGAAEQRLRDYLQRETHPVNRSLAFNQLAQCLQARSEYDQAYQCWASANRILLENHPAARADDRGSYGMTTLGETHDWLQQHPVDGWSGTPPVDHEPVFLVGFPRSGTTLLDRALSAHPEIEVLEEIELLDGARQMLVDEGRLSGLQDASAAQLKAAQQDYLARRQDQRVQSEASLVIDKLPLNLAYLYLVRRLFPRARVLMLLRDPRDVTLSCFFQSFELQGAMPYFLDLQKTAAYYDQLMRLATLQFETLGLAVHELRYEGLVTSFESELGKVLSFLGLPWSDDVMDYRRKSADRAIDTPSYQQVSQPLYRDSIERWKHYRQPLEAVNPRLEPWVKRFGYSPI